MLWSQTRSPCVVRYLPDHGLANATCAPECHDGFDLTEASTCDPFTGGFRSGRCLCACDDAWRAKGFYM